MLQCIAAGADVLRLGAQCPDRVAFPRAHTQGNRRGHLHAGRNEVARAFLDKSEAEWLFFIDSDMGFAPDTVDRLVASADPETRPVVGGLAFAQKSAGPGPIGARRFRANPTLYRAAEVDNRIGFVPMFDYPPDQLVEVQATGAACLLIHRTVLEAGLAPSTGIAGSRSSRYPRVSTGSRSSVRT